MAKEIEMEPLYELQDWDTQTYICSVNGQICERASEHFREFKSFIDDLANVKSKRLISVKEVNACLGLPPLVPDCPIWTAEMKKRQQELSKRQKELPISTKIKRFFGKGTIENQR
ncbi:MAG: hypothetical protein IJL05_02215 [Alphaproteobacteria bacterium]|nr:hypothetical protein [Alphaproteobacteria bacterium]MBQ6110172.1 hypothetical protein [Alphaproteobacteria bacterium]